MHNLGLSLTRTSQFNESQGGQSGSAVLNSAKSKPGFQKQATLLIKKPSTDRPRTSDTMIVRNNTIIAHRKRQALMQNRRGYQTNTNSCKQKQTLTNSSRRATFGSRQFAP